MNPLAWMRSRLFPQRREKMTLSEFMQPLRLRIGGTADANVTSPYCQSPWVYAGASAKARNLAGIPFVVKRGRHDAADGVPVPSTDPLSRLFSRPNPFMSMAAMMEAISILLDTDGECFLVMLATDGKPSRKGAIPAELMLYRSQQVKLDEAAIDRRTKMVTYWTICDQLVGAESVIQFARYNPNNPYRGMSPLTAAMMGIQTEFKASAYSMSMLDNDCTPGVILKLDGYVGQDGIESVKKDFKNAHRGARRAREPLVLNAGMEVENVSFSPADMQMPQEREWSREVVKAVLGVTDHEMGTAGDLNRASSIAAKRWLWDNTLIPLCNFIEETFWFGMFANLSMGGSDVWVEFDLSKVDALSSDMTEKAQQATALVDLGYTLNQVNDRVGLGMPVVPWGNEPSSEPVPTDGVQIGPVAASPGGDVQIGKPAASNPEAGVTVKGMTARGRARLMRRWNDSATSFLGGQIGKFYRSVRRELVKLPGKKSLPDLTAAQIDEILGAPQEWKRMAEAMLSGPVNRVTMSALRNARTLIGGFEVITPDDPQWMLTAARRTGQLVRVAIRWRGRIRDAILRSVASGDQSVTTLSQLLDREFGNVIKSSGMTIARTETAMLGNQVRNDVFKAEGIDEKEWSAANDAHTRESHAAIDGERVGMDDRFSNGLLYPSDPSGPPEEIINCRCVAVPRVK